MNNKSQERIDVWEKWDWLWPAIFYGSIAVATILAVIDLRGLTADLAAMLGLTALWVTWHTIGMRIAYNNLPNFEQRAYQRFIVIIGDIIFWFILVNMNPNYYYALFGVFSQVFRNLPIRWSAIATIILVGLLGYKEFADQGLPFSFNEPLFWISLFMSIGAIIFAAWVAAIINQSHRRRELLEELEAAQAELAAAERREGVLQERQRLAREIHDTLAQGFTSIVMHLEAAEAGMPDDLQITQNHLDRARSTARTSLEQARRVLQDLRPELLEHNSLAEAINRAAERWSEGNGISVAMTITGEQWPQHQEIEVTLLRAAQEGLNNIGKHAGASQVQLTLSYMADMIILDVQDDGQGVEDKPKGPQSGGFGLKGMRERVEGLGGEVEIESEQGEGTTLVVMIPCSSARIPQDANFS